MSGYDPSDLSQYIVRENEVLNDTVVHLDGQFFIRCALVRCTLVFSGNKMFGYADTRIDACRFRFEGAAKLSLAAIVSLMPSILTEGEVRDLLRQVAGGFTLGHDRLH